ncbi:MAG TPA: DEAD/DEAH box helicase [Rugosimonospora sp.]|nr:DEAD/DEAH box helicase [Rugosimonospora sp.]
MGEELRERAQEVLEQLAGTGARLREDQWQAIEALVAGGRRVLCVQRTGWGKSAVYFVATVLLRERGEGPTVIVSPLLALMRNQVEAASRAGIAARTINSANLDEWDSIVVDAHAGEVDLLLISPERLNNPDFRDTLLPKLAETAGLLVVDEAHCISDWGHDFRPDYRRLRTLLARLRPGTPVLATTATANARVTADVAEQLGTEDSAALVLRGPLDRESLRLGVVEFRDAAHRLGWLADHLAELPGSGIIYTLTVAAAHETAEFLRARGHAVSAYTGRSEDGERRAAEADLLANRLKALVATSALGMGFDKPDVGFVVHLGAPPSPIAYYQQVGRAGRAVDRAAVVLLPGREDRAIWAYFASLAFPPEEQVRAVLDALASADRPLSTPALEVRVDLRRTRLELMLKVLDVDGAVRRVSGGWVSTGADWVYDRDRLRRVAQAREAEQRLIQEYATLAGCRMEYLRRCLDDPAAVACGRCDNCTGEPFPAGVSAPALAAAEAYLGRPGVEVEPRKMWPTGLPAVGVPHTGKIPAGELAEPGRALGRLSDLGWGEVLRRMLAPDAPDGPPSAEVVAALVQVLKAWDWARRPAAVVSIGSGRRPLLVRGLAERIAGIGRLDLLGEVPSPAGGGTARANSAQRVRALYGGVAVPELLAARLAGLTGPVLLVDDLVDSGWTMALVARALRAAGAPAVLPLALALSA